MATSTVTASDTASQVVDLLMERKASIKDEHKLLDNEERQIDRTLKAMDGLAPARRGRPPKALPAGPSKAKAPRKIAKRKRKGGTRAEQAVGLINDAGEKGIDATKIAKVMKIKPNYLYRVLGGLEKEGLVRKDGRMYYPVTA